VPMMVNGKQTTGVPMVRALGPEELTWESEHLLMGKSDIADVKCRIQAVCTVGICSNTERGYCASLGGVFKRLVPARLSVVSIDG
jgi:hypothetical protein